jgi:hypothetical protein
MPDLTPAAVDFPIEFFLSLVPLTGDTDGEPGELLLELNRNKNR